jgi:hypothetical protein
MYYIKILLALFVSTLMMILSFLMPAESQKRFPFHHTETAI